MDSIRTNRELYVAIADLMKREAENSMTLEAYLRNVHALGCGAQSNQQFTPDEFVSLLREAFAVAAPKPPSPKLSAIEVTASAGFAKWESVLLEQLTDLRQMEASGQLGNKLRYLGIDSPSGRRWFNFDPRTYLECATCGMYGGWREIDDTGRQ